MTQLRASNGKVITYDMNHYCYSRLKKLVWMGKIILLK